jgi:uncharacterized membrane protein YidH (DUF202 family)
MTSLIGVTIILVGLVFFVLGALPFLSIVEAVAQGKPVPSFGGNAGLLLGAGISMMAYGWQCVKGLKNR